MNTAALIYSAFERAERKLGASIEQISRRDPKSPMLTELRAAKLAVETLRAEIGIGINDACPG